MGWFKLLSPNPIWYEDETDFRRLSLFMIPVCLRQHSQTKLHKLAVGREMGAHDRNIAVNVN